MIDIYGVEGATLDIQNDNPKPLKPYYKTPSLEEWEQCGRFPRRVGGYAAWAFEGHTPDFLFRSARG
jgi:hypothetical protein